MQLTNFLEQITSVVVSSDNRFIVSGSKDKTIKIFNIQTRQEIHHITNIHHSIYSLLLC